MQPLRLDTGSLSLAYMTLAKARTPIALRLGVDIALSSGPEVVQRQLSSVQTRDVDYVSGLLAITDL